MAATGEDTDHHDGYTGAAVLVVDGLAVPVRAVLDARHEPHDGRLHWFGRVTPTPDADLPADLPAALAAPSARVELHTGTGRAPARIGDVDPWGRYRVTGVGPPPFRTDDPHVGD